MTLAEQIRAVFDVVMEYTETPEHDQAMGRAMKAIRQDCNQSEVLILQRVVGMLYDGLTYGNWPWAPNRALGSHPAARHEVMEALRDLDDER